MITSPTIQNNAQFQLYGKSNNNQNTSPIAIFKEALAKATAQRLRGYQDEEISRAREYMAYLQSKYGTVSIQDVGKDQLSLERIGKGMRGRDVVIAPNIFKEMANDPEKAAYYEGQIDSVFDKIPEYTAQFATQGLTFQSCGVVVHEDGTVTHISGSCDSPEKVAKVEEENRAKREKRAERLKEMMERMQESADKQRQFSINETIKADSDGKAVDLENGTLHKERLSNAMQLPEGIGMTTEQLLEWQKARTAPILFNFSEMYEKLGVEVKWTYDVNGNRLFGEVLNSAGTRR